MKILVPVDGSASSIIGLEKAVEYAQKFSAELLLINVQHDHYTDEAMLGLRAPLVTLNADQLEEIGNRVLDQMTATIKDGTVKIVKRVLFGDPADSIVAFAEEEKVDRIIIGSKGLTGIKRFMLGSVALKVATYAHCTVVIVKPNEA